MDEMSKMEFTLEQQSVSTGHLSDEAADTFLQSLLGQSTSETELTSLGLSTSKTPSAAVEDEEDYDENAPFVRSVEKMVALDIHNSAYQPWSSTTVLSS